MNVGKYEKGVEFGHTAGTRHGVSNNSWITDPHSKVSGVAAGVFREVILDTPFVCRTACLTARRLNLESVNLRIRLWIFHEHSRDSDLVVASTKHLTAWVSNAIFVYFTRTKEENLMLRIDRLFCRNRKRSLIDQCSTFFSILRYGRTTFFRSLFVTTKFLSMIE